MVTVKTGKWIKTLRAVPNAKFRLLLFPCAGGSANSYYPWSKYLPSFVEAQAIELPGRSERLHETPPSAMLPVIESVCSALDELNTLPTAFFGHSFGALLAFEVCRKLRLAGRSQPLHLFVAGRIAPQIPLRKPKIHHLPDASFLEKVSLLGGIPPELLLNSEIMDLLTPSLRADIMLHETYQYTEQPPLSCPTTAFGGIEDHDVTLEDLKEWRKQTSAEFDLQQFDGGHFFVQSEQEQIIAIILRKLIAANTGR
jgi:medium-chain acyl-[acyl-carrier-protein] hydrolase